MVPDALPRLEIVMCQLIIFSPDYFGGICKLNLIVVKYQVGSYSKS